MSKPAPASKPARPAPAATSPAAVGDASTAPEAEAPEADALRAEVNALRERIAVLEASPRAPSLVEVDAVDLSTIEPVSSDATTLLALCAAVNLGAPDNVRGAALRLAARLASQVAP